MISFFWIIYSHSIYIEGFFSHKENKQSSRNGNKTRSIMSTTLHMGSPKQTVFCTSGGIWRQQEGYNQTRSLMYILCLVLFVASCGSIWHTSVFVCVWTRFLVRIFSIFYSSIWTRSCFYLSLGENIYNFFALLLVANSLQIIAHRDTLAPNWGFLYLHRLTIRFS